MKKILLAVSTVLILCSTSAFAHWHGGPAFYFGVGPYYNYDYYDYNPYYNNNYYYKDRVYKECWRERGRRVCRYVDDRYYW